MTERKRSIIWSYFTPVNNDEASCDICQKTIRHCGNTTNMTKHLKVKHPKEHDEIQLTRAEEATQTRHVYCGLFNINNDGFQNAILNYKKHKKS